MSARLRNATNIAAAVAVMAALALGALWLRDRTRRWEEPRWGSRSFVLVRGGAPAPGGPTRMATWVAPVNPRCPHCVTTLRRLHDTWSTRGAAAGLIALIVDTAARPHPSALRAIPPVPVWWDRHGIWRRRWGHRLYGELIEFDGSGRFVRTATAHEVLRDLRPDPAVKEPFAPITSNQGGS